jgi:hypothetical protein
MRIVICIIVAMLLHPCEGAIYFAPFHVEKTVSNVDPFTPNFLVSQFLGADKLQIVSNYLNGLFGLNYTGPILTKAEIQWFPLGMHGERYPNTELVNDTKTLRSWAAIMGFSTVNLQVAISGILIGEKATVATYYHAENIFIEIIKTDGQVIHKLDVTNGIIIWDNEKAEIGLHIGNAAETLTQIISTLDPNAYFMNIALITGNRRFNVSFPSVSYLAKLITGHKARLCAHILSEPPQPGEDAPWLQN